jgi:hypothetical protein
MAKKTSSASQSKLNFGKRKSHPKGKKSVGPKQEKLKRYRGGGR